MDAGKSSTAGGLRRPRDPHRRNDDDTYRLMEYDHTHVTFVVTLQSGESGPRASTGNIRPAMYKRKRQTKNTYTSESVRSADKIPTTNLSIGRK